LGRIAEFIPTNLSIHWNQFALFSRFLPFFAFFAAFLSNVNFQSVTKKAKNVTKCQFCPLQKIKGFLLKKQIKTAPESNPFRL